MQTILDGISPVIITSCWKIATSGMQGTLSCCRFVILVLNCFQFPATSHTCFNSSKVRVADFGSKLKVSDKRVMAGCVIARVIASVKGKLLRDRARRATLTSFSITEARV